jgi:hypothetical protein
MTNTDQTLRDDIAFMRNLAEAGRERPMLGGAILLACGLIFGLASLAVWYLATYQGMGGTMYPTVWGVALVLYVATLVPLLRAIPRTANAAQTAAGMAWSAAGWACFVIAVSLMVVATRLNSWIVMWALPSVFLALYGAIWLLAANLWRKGWIYLVSIGAFAAALACAWFASAGDAVWLIYGVSLILVLSVPGFAMMRQARESA